MPARSDTRSFLAIAASLDAMHGISTCLHGIGNVEGSRVAAQGVMSLSKALARPAEACQALVANRPTSSSSSSTCKRAFHPSDEEALSKRLCN